MDLLGLPRLSRLRRLPLPGVLRGLLRRRVQGPARRLLGDPPAGRPRRASATGTCRSGARSSPACAARGTHDDRDRRPPRRRRRREDGARRPRRALRLSEGGGAEILLRRARLAAVRADHRAARVLPDPGRAARSSQRARAEIHDAAGCPSTLVELGSGSAAKTRHLLGAMRDCDSLDTYVPVDISEEITERTAAELVDEYPGLHVHGLVCDFEQHLERVPARHRAADDRLPRRHDRQPLPAPAARLPRADRGIARARATTSSSAPT